MWRLLGIFFLAQTLDQIDGIHEAATRADREEELYWREQRRIQAQEAREDAAYRAEQRRKHARREGARRYKKHADGKPFRVFQPKAFTTMYYWISGRKFSAETYFDGSFRGYVVYEGLFDSMELLSPLDFDRRFGRWVD